MISLMGGSGLTTFKHTQSKELVAGISDESKSIFTHAFDGAFLLGPQF